MLKGCQREMVVVKGDSESVFESAYFLLKKSPRMRGGKNPDMIECANDLIKESCFSSRKKRRLRTIILCAVCFVLGALCALPAVFIIL